MLHVGLTGGIGSGKSSVARHLVARGAVLVDADVLAREVVAAGTAGFAAVVAEFGERVVRPDGELDRPALGAVVFGDATARARLSGIVHPLVRERSAALVAAAPPDAVVVQDIPLLVEGGMARRFALVVVVHADAEVRVARLGEHRGMAAADAWARIAAQAGDDDRRASADVWLDNSGTPADLTAALDRLWDARIVAFEENVRADRAAPAPAHPVPADTGWAPAAARLVARVTAAAGDHGRGVAHIGATAVAGLPAADVLQLQIGVAGLPAADGMRAALREVGFVRRAPDHFASADPGRPADLHVREIDGPQWREALLCRDWLRADSGARDAYRRAVGEADAADGFATVEQRWWRTVNAAANRWGASSGWAPSLH